MAFYARAIVQWIDAEVGGRSPVIGLRPALRFQRKQADETLGSVSVEIVDLDSDLDRTVAMVRFPDSYSFAKATASYLRSGELIVLLDSYRVIGVGKITEVCDPGMSECFLAR